MARRGASGMLSFARRMVSSAISVRRLHRAVRWWAFTQSCSSSHCGQNTRTVYSCGWQTQEVVIVTIGFCPNLKLRLRYRGVAEFSGNTIPRRDTALRSDSMRQMEAADWASLSDAELLER